MKALLDIEGYLRMCDSGLTGFMYWAVGAAGAQLYKNSVNSESHIRQYLYRRIGMECCTRTYMLSNKIVRHSDREKVSDKVFWTVTMVRTLPICSIWHIKWTKTNYLVGLAKTPWYPKENSIITILSFLFNFGLSCHAEMAITFFVTKFFVFKIAKGSDNLASLVFGKTRQKAH